MDLLRPSKHKHTKSFLDYNLEEDLLPSITKPTRISKTCATLLDNIFISRRLQCSFASGIIITDLSDHLSTLVSLKDFKHETKLQRIVTYRKIIKDTIQKMDEEIKSYNWNEILNKLNTEESFNVLHEALIRAFNTHMPERSKRLGNKVTRNEPWITNGIKTTITKQKKLYKRTLLEKSSTRHTETCYKG